MKKYFYRLEHTDPSIWVYDSDIHIFTSKKEALSMYNKILKKGLTRHASLKIEKVELIKYTKGNKK